MREVLAGMVAKEEEKKTKDLKPPVKKGNSGADVASGSYADRHAVSQDGGELEIGMQGNLKAEEEETVTFQVDEDADVVGTSLAGTIKTSTNALTVAFGEPHFQSAPGQRDSTTEWYFGDSDGNSYMIYDHNRDSYDPYEEFDFSVNAKKGSHYLEFIEWANQQINNVAAYILHAAILGTKVV